MARYTCPSCGSRYNGKKCRSCLYEQFTEEIAHGSHVHKGEPLVIDAPVRRPVKQKDPFGCEKKTRKKRPLAGLVVILAILNSLLPMVRDWGLELEAIERGHIAAEPEPVMQPENTVIFHREADVTVFTNIAAFEGPLEEFSLYVENGGDTDVTVSAGEIQVNGCPMPHSVLVCKARAGEIGKGWLELDAADLEAAEIQELQTLTFTLTAIQNGRILFTTTEIPIIAEGTV